MKEMVFIIILGVSVIMTTKQDKNFIVRAVYSVDSVEVLNTTEKEIRLKLISTVPNPCYQFAHIETKQADAQILITVFAKIDKNVNCISLLGKMEAEVTIPVTKPGKYNLIFEGQSKNKEISVEVNDG
jgi:hypothetical protein